MEDKDFNEMLLNDPKKAQKSKNIILGVIALVVVLVVVLIIWSLMRPSNKNEMTGSNYSQTQEHVDSPFAESNFDNTNHAMEMGSNHDELDSFDKIINDMKNANVTEQMPSQMSEETHSNLAMDSNTMDMHQENSQQKQSSMQPQVSKDTPMQKQSMSKTSSNAVKKSNNTMRRFDDSNFEKATKGSYLQVGVFANKPNEEMQKILLQHSFKILEITDQDRKLTKYLIGPFKSRVEANQYKRSNPQLKGSVYFEVK